MAHVVLAGGMPWPTRVAWSPAGAGRGVGGGGNGFRQVRRGRRRPKLAGDGQIRPRGAGSGGGEELRAATRHLLPMTQRREREVSKRERREGEGEAGATGPETGGGGAVG